MSGPSAYVLKIKKNRISAFENSPTVDESFGESVPTFDHSLNSPLICLVLAEPGFITHIGRGHPARGRNSAGYQLRVLHTREIVTLKKTIKVSDVVESVEARVQHHASRAFEAGGMFPDKTFQNVIDSMRLISKEASNLLALYGTERRERIKSIPSKVRKVLAEQKDTVAVALNIAGIDRKVLSDWSPLEFEATRPQSYLSGLEQVHLREDQMIIHDLSHFPGLEGISAGPHNSVVFENLECKLAVLMTNRLPLEEVTGADLIYFNETYNSYVFVQYKAMETSKQGNSIFRFASDDQLAKQLKAMRSTAKALSSIRSTIEKEDFRFAKNPFYFKLCPRIQLDPDGIDLISGMYIPLRLWQRIAKDKSMIGKKGGRLITYSNVGRYLNNTEFAMLVRKAWIGTTLNQSNQLKTFIRNTLQSGRSLTFAIEQRSK